MGLRQTLTVIIESLGIICSQQAENFLVHISLHTLGRILKWGRIVEIATDEYWQHMLCTSAPGVAVPEALHDGLQLNLKNQIN